MADSFKNLQGLGNCISVAIPADEHGMVGRECPRKECLGYFKVKPGTGLTGPSLRPRCPYCGEVGDAQSFWTQEQIAYAKSVAFRKITEAVTRDLKQFEFDRPARGTFGIGISMKLMPGPLPPIRHYREKTLETSVDCDACTLKYAVFGLFSYCPDCGIHNSLQVLNRNLQLVQKQLDLAATLEDPAFRQHLVDDALENCVSSFDGFGRETCRVRAAKSQDPNRARELSFQNLRKAVVAVQGLFNADVSATVDPVAWRRVEIAFQKRHLLAHCSGVVDEKYVRETGDSSATVGRRVTIDPGEVADVAATVGMLGANLVKLLPAP